MINSDTTALLELEEITKTYPGVVALDAVSFSVGAGEVVGLIGENGAGKSTLMKVLGGVTAPTAGRIRVDGTWTDRLTVQQSLEAGIAFVHQELNLFDNLDVAANVYLGREMTRGPLGLIDRKAMADAVQPLLRQLGAGYGPHTRVADLSLAERQLLEIAKALSLNSRVVIMDEPTSSLTLSETGVLLTVIADLKRRGISVVFISHRLSEVEACADRVVVLRDGRVAGALDRSQIGHAAMIRLMTGRDLKALYNPPRRPPGAPALSVRGLRTFANPDASVDLDVRAGEILGVAGLVGAGRTEMAQAIFGIDPAHAGRVTIGGRELSRPDPVSAIAAGLYLVPEDRQDTGLIIDMAVCENVSLADLRAMSRYGMVRRRREIRVAEDQCQRLSIKTAGVLRAAAEMSGGNQQKVVLAKWLSMRPKVFIFDEPTRGIDVGAKAEIYRLMRALADEGVGIMMISSDMEEVIGVSDRIAVMHAGAISGLLERTDFSETNVLTLAVGRAVERA
jgi:ribose transport system ATP-binding protein